jgi:hypothetical protein
MELNSTEKNREHYLQKFGLGSYTLHFFLLLRPFFQSEISKEATTIQNSAGFIQNRYFELVPAVILIFSFISNLNFKSIVKQKKFATITQYNFNS